MAKKELSISEIDKNMAPLPDSDVPLVWYEPSAEPFRLSGFPWFDTDGVLRRLPVAARDTIPQPVDGLANCTAGGQVAFQSDSSRVAVAVKLTAAANMDIMPPSGQCGCDLYTGLPHGQRFHGVTKFDHNRSEYEVMLFEYEDGKTRNFTLNLPLYQGVECLRIGLKPGCQVTPPPDWDMPGRIVFYGTSITQGGCASRPGMAFTNILSRRFNAEVINLGFSGSGNGEPEVMRLVAEVADPAIIALDYEANAGYDGIRATLEDNIKILRDAHPQVPIMVVSRIPWSCDLYNKLDIKRRTDGRDFQGKVVAAARDAGDAKIHFVDGFDLLGPGFDECTVDGCHPNDLGFMQMADNLEREIRRILTAGKR